ncbi:unnamed protein product [Parajaminaea phylloscopi]
MPHDDDPPAHACDPIPTTQPRRTSHREEKPDPRVANAVSNRHPPGPHLPARHMASSSSPSREDAPGIESPIKGTAAAALNTTADAHAAATPRPSRPASRASTAISNRRARNLILGVAVVDFNHLQGPIVEWSHPSSLQTDHPDLTASLPFCALPDGSHLSDEDFAHFHLYCPSVSKHSTVFGISCNRQIAADKLAVKGKEVTRSTVQKAVVVLARQPVFAPLREKLGIVTRAFFTQGDLADTSLLVDFHGTLEAGLRAAGLRAEEVAEDDDFADDDDEPAEQQGHIDTQGPSRQGSGEDSTDTATALAGQGEAPRPAASTSASSQAPSELREGVMYMGTSLRELIYKFRFKTLMLVKLLLLQRRIMFFGYPVERLCVYEYTLVSLIPGLLLSLSDCASPELDYTSRHKLKVAEDVKTSDRRSLLRFCGCPLRLFGNDAFFQPYLPLQQIEMLKSTSWLVGTTNLIFKQQKEFRPDVVVDLEQSSLDFLSAPATASNAPSPAPNQQSHVHVEPTLQQIVSLTPADRKWMDELVHVVTESYNPEDPGRPTTMRFEGSEDWVRAKFEDYICSMLACVKYSDFLDKSNPAAAPGTSAGVSESGTFTPSAGSGVTLAGSNVNTAGIEAPDSVQAIHAFNPLFISAFKKTRAYSLWSSSTSPLLFDLVPYRHPCAGKVSALEDVGLRLSAGLYDLKLDEQVRDTREYVEKAGRGLFSMAERFGSEVAKRRRDWIAAQEAHQQQQAQAHAHAQSEGPRRSADGTAVDNIASSSSPLASTSASASARSSQTPGMQSDLASQLAPHAAAAQQAAMQAGTEVRAALGRFGSFLGSRGWGSGSAAPAATASSSAPAPAPGLPPRPLTLPKVLDERSSTPPTTTGNRDAT